MPQVYRRQPDYSSRPVPVPRRRSSMAPQGPQPTDADDSIVLADLVRTGEASRLRRRGAMRLDHGPATAARAPLVNASAAGPSAYAPPARPIVIEPSRTPSPELNADENGGDEYTYTAGPAWRGWDTTPSQEGRAEGLQTVEILNESIQAGQSFTLFCGGDEVFLSDEEDDDPPRPFVPSLFPIMPSAGTSHSKPVGKSIRRSNGCGALVHVRAYPQRPRGVWMAKENASETVVGLDAQYCDHPAMDKMLKSACGCIREGIGCSVCGNTLGTRYVPCQAASESFFAPSPPSSVASSPPRPVRPFGPSYWNARSATHHRCNSSTSLASRSTPSSYYTFFADRVSSSPSYEFFCTPRSPTPESFGRVAPRPESPEIDYGYRWTASPVPVNAALPTGDPPATATYMTAPLTPVYTLPPLPPITRSPSQMRPPSAPIRIPRVGLDLRTPTGSLSTPGGGPGMQVGMDVDPDGEPLADVEMPGSPDKEGISWPGR
ncbi:hypothetical protein PYCCODRAFT_1450928 [Trametes coccinea BRFM310]|uniref:Uncharacterized protein n=1 Tax=Trametes coccinea (strain BRFM310) TaxID=1353009 RepID=A0A1Y2ITE4_TRAC3|nr:hypothetical protein PYCCODRAFT_1450928 [Trametes coccinea BRFM310]